MGVFTNAGRNLWAKALQKHGVSASVQWVDFAQGCGTLASPLIAGTPVGSLTLDADLPVALTPGDVLIITDGTLSDTATVGTPPIGVTLPANAIITTYTPAHNTVVTPQQGLTDTGLYNGSDTTWAVRIAANPGIAGGGSGESVLGGFFDGSQAGDVYIQVGYFGGSTATSSPGTGTLIAEDQQYWKHAGGGSGPALDSATPQLDVTLT